MSYNREEIREKYKDIFEHSLDFVFVFDLKGNLLDANDIMLKRIEYKRNELLKLSFKDLLDNENLQKANQNIKEFSETGQQSTYSEYKVKTKSGNIIYIETFGIPLRKKGEIYSILGIAKDITDLKNAQERLKRSEKKYRDLFETTPFSIVLLTADGIIIDCNPSLERMFGYKKTEIIGRHFENISIIHQDFLPYLKKLFIKLLNGEEVHRTDLQMYRKDETLIWVTIQASILEIGGKIFVQVVIHDITKRKNLTQQLLESENLYKTLVRTSPNAIVVTDLQGKIIEISQRAIELYGGDTMDDLIGKNSLDYLRPEDQPIAIENLQKALNGETIKVEYDLVRKDGTYYICELNANLIKAADGKPKAFIGIMRDITEQKHAEKKLKESEEQYRHLYENAPISLWTARISDGKFIQANENSAKIMGYDNLDEFLNKCRSMDIVPYEFRRDIFRRLKEEGEITGIEASITDNKGNEKIITISMKLYSDLGYIEGVSTDITELKNVQKALKESEEKYRHLFEESPNMLFLLDLKGNIFDVNTRFLETFAFKEQELIGKNFQRIARFDDVNTSVLSDKYEKLIKNGHIKPFEVPFTNELGEIRWYNLQASLTEIGNKQMILVILQDIHERKQAEQNLKESEEQYRTTINSFSDPLYVVDTDLKIILANPALERWLISLDLDIDIIGKPIYETFPFLQEAIRKQYEQVFNSGIQHFSEESMIFGDRQIITEVRKIPIFKDENVNQVVTIVRDITKKKNIENKLKASETKYRHLFESAPFLIGLADLDGNILALNSATNQFIIRREKDELIGKNFREIFSFHEEEKPFIPKAEEQIEKLLRGETTDLFEFPLVRSDGSIQWVNLNLSLVNIGEETLIQLILQDITKRKKAEQRLKKSEEKFRRIFESIPDFYFLFSSEGIILDYKGRVEDLYLPPENFLGKQIQDIFPKGLVDQSIEAIKKTIENKEPTIIEYNLPIRGEERYYEARILYFSKDQVAVFVREITERKKAELLVEEEFKKLKELEQIRKDLISRVSHELKTPLIPVISGSELLRSVYNDQLGEDAREIIEMIDKGGRRLKELVEQLLNVSRIEYDKLKIEKERTNLSEIIKESSNNMKYILEQRKIALRLDIPEKFWLKIDKNRIGEVITNLLSNAIKFTPPYGRVTIELHKQDDTAVIRVIDTGVGLTEKEMETLFTRFGKIERYNEGLEYIDIKGSGLGLYICKEILKIHGGQIWAESEGRNKGSTFIVKLPLN